ncbi:MAG: hypothetical protein ACI4CS_06545 [Candidatus Weimeria sp.]
MMLECVIKAEGNTSQGLEKEAAGMLKDCKVKDMPSSYAYLVDKDGTMLYHPTAENKEKRSCALGCFLFL